MVFQTAFKKYISDPFKRLMKFRSPTKVAFLTTGQSIKAKAKDATIGNNVRAKNPIIFGKRKPYAARVSLLSILLILDKMTPLYQYYPRAENK
jgi:hypothetical protein